MDYIVFSDLARVIICFLLAFFITSVLIPSIVNIAQAKSFVDIPNERASHSVHTPTLGGIAIFIGVLISSLMLLNFYNIPRGQYVIAGLIIVFFIGYKDDLVGISPYKKFFGQIMAALIVIEFGQIHLTNLHGFLLIYSITNNFGLVLSLITIIGLTNCYNLIDGIDGLSATQGILATAAFGAWFFLTGNFEWAVLSAGMIGALVAFLYFNLFSRTNKIFMGDTGSLILGFFIAILAIRFNEASIGLTGTYAANAAPAVSVGIVIIPVFDTLRVFVTRLALNKQPFYPDKTHIHHYLLNLGFSHVASTAILFATGLGFIAISILLRNLTVFWLLTILMTLAAGLSAIPIMLYRWKLSKELKEIPFRNPH
ncbi:MAG: MraY family glycosyltransferase [Bacteroidetes bacterium]|nr:MraY family glycosyltransferase [Bacteroidota bacterium]